MRCYNAAMKRPFQFSMRAMFWAVSFCCLGAWLLAALRRFSYNPFEFYLAFVVAAAIVSAAAGSRVKKTLAGPILITGTASVLFALLLFAAGPGFGILCPALTERGIGKNNDALVVILMISDRADQIDRRCRILRRRRRMPCVDIRSQPNLAIPGGVFYALL
jgi:hypothetical protein